MKPIRERRLQLIDHFTHRDVEWQLSRLLAAHGAKILSSEGIETLAKMLVAEMRYGHVTLKEVERYTKAADQKRMARSAMEAISRTESRAAPRGAARR
jgi:hypothetical protein